MKSRWTLATAMRSTVGASLLSVAIATHAVHAQSYFGQNQVQYDNFKWQVLETEHFLVYHYPEERPASMVAARMAERAYARLSRILDHQFREKKPIVLFSSRTDFGQNNITGDLGEATLGVTEALRQRMLLNFTGDFRSFEHVLTHEMTHAFQYDIFARGKAGTGLQNLAQNMPPLWFAEGMAEYLSLGPSTPLTNAWMRDAALNGKIPTVEQMTGYPERFFPYRFGHAFWTYVGQRWGDESIGQIMNAVPSVGVERAFKRELGESLEDLGDEWRESLQTQQLPQVGSLERPRKFAQALLTSRRTGGEVFLAPALSNDGKYIAFLSNGSFLKGEVFIDLWLGDAETGKRIKRLVKSTLDPNFEELRVLYSQSAFSPDGKLLAFTGQREGRDVLYLLDVKSRATIHRFDLDLESVSGPSWSPDGKRLVFSGYHGGITDLYVVDADGKNFHQLTNDLYGDLQPQWSPDGKTIAFATDRGEGANLELLRFPQWRVALLDVESGAISVLPNQGGLNTNPQWAPDGKSIAYVSDRTGIANVFLYDFDAKEHYQLTNVVGAISAVAEYSPSISWARGADRLAFTYYDDGEYTIWQVSHPRNLKHAPYRDAKTTPVTVAIASGAMAADSDTTVADSVPTPPAGVSIAALLDSAELALPDTTKFTEYPYRLRFQPDYVARPSIGYAPDSYGRNVFGGTTVILSDMLGNNRLALAGEINGRLSEAQMYFGYANLGRRLQYNTSFSQFPYYFLSNDVISEPDAQGQQVEQQEITIYVARQLFATASYPLNRFSRFELGGGLNDIGRQRLPLSRTITDGTYATPFTPGAMLHDRSLNYAEAHAAYVSDNTLWGYTGPIYGRRYRFQVSPVMGNLNWIEYLADYRRYDAILFNYLTFATRAYASISAGPDETQFMKYIARPDFVRGYDRNNVLFLTCPIIGASSVNCSAVQLLGSRVAVANAELRFPLLRRVELGVLPMSLPPLDGLFFYDAGMAWSKNQTVYGSRPPGYDGNKQRYPLRSYGFGLRLNLFNYATLRWDYARPLDQPGGKHGFWTWSLWPSF
ncbi:MAG TPA: BamA/TamA family outer membrane protein [Gemmatimonadaceae bacterium]|nr:BamA/TamA family outer membrane protein [Gemmatimonadaceae bacterium]